MQWIAVLCRQQVLHSTMRLFCAGGCYKDIWIEASIHFAVLVAVVASGCWVARGDCGCFSLTHLR
jgi:hypothetical protein